jgi:hypothetical protein
MIAARAIKVYEFLGDPYGDFVTTVFSMEEAKRLERRLLKRQGVHRVILKDVKNNILNRTDK